MKTFPHERIAKIHPEPRNIQNEKRKAFKEMEQELLLVITSNSKYQNTMVIM